MSSANWSLFSLGLNDYIDVLSFINQKDIRNNLHQLGADIIWP